MARPLRPLVLCVAIACGGAHPAATNAPPPTTVASASPAAPSANEAFARVAASFLAGYLKREPQQATELGDHHYDDKWPDLSEAGDRDLRAFLSDARKGLSAVPRDALSDQNQVDARMLDDQIDRALFYMDEIRQPETDPVLYTSVLGDGLDPLVARDFAPLRERMTSLRARLLGVPAVVAAARARLKNPPRLYTETAIERVTGLVALCQGGLADPLSAVPDMRADVQAAGDSAAKSLVDFKHFLETELLPRSTGSFRLGRARFENVLRYEIGDEIHVDALAEDAQAAMDDTLEEMVVTARELWPTLLTGPAPKPATVEEKRAMVAKVLAKLGDDATAPATILDLATATLGDATRFVKEHDLVSLPTEPCKVIEMPEYKRGLSIAYCESSGPLEKKQETFYAISPAPRTWSAKRAASFYREYNRSMLNDLTVHEAMPGHYLQAMHANAFHSDVRTVFSNGAFVEGWAVYGEWLMAKNGFGGPKTRMQRLKMFLRVCANVLLDHGIHAGAMDEKEAMALMTEQAFQEDAEAAAKWNRARLTFGQLSTYFYGFREFMKLREGAEKRPSFHEKAYHDRLLAQGAPPMRELRWILERPAMP